MADFNNSAAPVLLTDATALFAGIRDTPEVAALLLPYQIEVEDEVAEGLALVEEVQAAMGHQRAEAAEATAATAAATAALTVLEVGYVRLRKLVRAVHKPGTPGYAALVLPGGVPDADPALIADTATVYRAAQENPALVAGLRGVTRATIEEGLARVEAARAAEAAQARESGEAQRATNLRNSAEARLRALAAEVAAVTEVALADAPQLREVVGLLERGS